MLFNLLGPKPPSPVPGTRAQKAFHLLRLRLGSVDQEVGLWIALALSHSLPALGPWAGTLKPMLKGWEQSSVGRLLAWHRKPSFHPRLPRSSPLSYQCSSGDRRIRIQGHLQLRKGCEASFGPCKTRSQKKKSFLSPPSSYFSVLVLWIESGSHTR